MMLSCDFQALVIYLVFEVFIMMMHSLTDTNTVLGRDSNNPLNMGLDDTVCANSIDGIDTTIYSSGIFQHKLSSEKFG